MPQGVKGTAMPIGDRRAKKRAYMVKWRAAHPEYMRSYTAKKYIKYGDRYRAYARKDNLKKKYGITLEQYDQMLADQHGVCAICKQPPKVYRLAVDHNHITNQVRKLLCTVCNTALGVLEDTEFVQKAEEYLVLYDEARKRGTDH